MKGKGKWKGKDGKEDERKGKWKGDGGEKM